MPIWIDDIAQWYGIPDIEGRASSWHNTPWDPPSIDSGERSVSEGLAALAPSWANGSPRSAGAARRRRGLPVRELLQRDFLIDRHPDFDNVWLVGGGSGHGFKHGPAVGEYVAERVVDGGPVDPRFSLATKGTELKREVT
jgi:glycine/D-amino acid oxidase-like deaminating enzyme